MNRHFLHLGYVALMMCVLFTACKKADVTATATDPQLTFALMPDSFTYTFTATTTVKPTFTWGPTATNPNPSIANITSFKLNAKRGGVASEYPSAGLSNVDIFLPGSLVSTISIPKSDYTEVKASIIFSKTTSTTLPLVLNGTYTSTTGVAIPVEFDLNDDVTISIPVLSPSSTPASSFAADGTKNFTANMAAHLSTLLYNVLTSEIETAVKTNGILIINNNTNNKVNYSIYGKMKANMVGCGVAVLSSKAR